MNSDDLWRVRVDLFAPEHVDHVYDDFVRVLRANIETFAAASTSLGVGVDRGTGMLDNSSFLGCLFWVQARTAGEAANLGIEIAGNAFRESGAGEPLLYDVVVIPSSAVFDPDDETFPPVPD